MKKIKILLKVSMFTIPAPKATGGVFASVKVSNAAKARWSLDVSHCPAGNVSSRNG